ncbi:type III secretion system outer membrane ring subunit SctC [Limnobacter sp. MED105]|uniref:type III secretion system outer membrane ring subunit SctC n=1 Tax=Limnobacter sp. MED105 TaxID=391597 RepID=UPI0012E9B0B3|nr:type III secretion system outer membrane ring subunit SctC [Limnobacter sp. MED105]
MKVFLKLLILALVLAPLVSRAATTDKVETKVYLAQDESAKRVIEKMLSMFGKRLVADSIPSSPVSGRFEVKTVDDVMAYFESAYQINWFQNGLNVYTYRSGNWRTKRIYVGGDRSNDDWKELLTSAGLYYKEFPFVFHMDSKELIVSGPASYLSLIEDSFQQDRPDPSEIAKHGTQLMVFPLKHASVEDRQTNLRGTMVTTPGALSVLLNLLGLPNQQMANSPEAKKPGMNVERSPYSLSPGEGLMMGERIGALPVSPSSGVKKKADDDPEKAEFVSVTADPRTNSILIRDAKSKYDYYKNLIDQLDRQVAMIEVEAMMVEVDQKGLNELGLEFGLLSDRFAYDFPGSGVGRPSLIAAGATSIVDPMRFMARLKALSADENAKVLARPTIVTQDNVSAYIDLSQTLYIQVSGERVADVIPITAGSLLQVTPRVVIDEQEERIFLRIEIQDGSLTENTQGINMPRVQNTSLSTQAVIQREKAILIGGYNRESTEVNDYKVPLLGDIPYIGKAFTSTEKRTQTVARLFLITPRLIDRPIHDSESTRKAVKELQMSFKLKGDNLEGTPSLKLDSTIPR